MQQCTEPGRKEQELNKKRLVATSPMMPGGVKRFLICTSGSGASKSEQSLTKGRGEDHAEQPFNISAFSLSTLIRM